MVEKYRSSQKTNFFGAQSFRIGIRKEKDLGIGKLIGTFKLLNWN